MQTSIFVHATVYVYTALATTSFCRKVQLYMQPCMKTSTIVHSTVYVLYILLQLQLYIATAFSVDKYNCTCNCVCRRVQLYMQLCMQTSTAAQCTCNCIYVYTALATAIATAFFLKTSRIVHATVYCFRPVLLVAYKGHTAVLKVLLQHKVNNFGYHFLHGILIFNKIYKIYKNSTLIRAPMKQRESDW